MTMNSNTTLELPSNLFADEECTQPFVRTSRLDAIVLRQESALENDKVFALGILCLAILLVLGVVGF